VLVGAVVLVLTRPGCHADPGAGAGVRYRTAQPAMTARADHHSVECGALHDSVVGPNSTNSDRLSGRQAIASLPTP
jgi:hypothetical protein